jgi:parallel beta-helix repeat protein
MNNTILEGGWSDSSPAHGIELMDSDEVNICNNTIDAYYDAGINLHWSNNCTIEGNNIACCAKGIRILVSFNNRILKNNLERNHRGITLYNSNDTLIYDNYLNNEDTNIGLNGYRNNIYKNTCLNALIG